MQAQRIFYFEYWNNNPINHNQLLKYGLSQQSFQQETENLEKERSFYDEEVKIFSTFITPPPHFPEKTYPRISPAIPGFPRISPDFSRFPWISPGFPGFPRVFPSFPTFPKFPRQSPNYFEIFDLNIFVAYFPINAFFKEMPLIINT